MGGYEWRQGRGPVPQGVFVVHWQLKEIVNFEHVKVHSVNHVIMQINFYSLTTEQVPLLSPTDLTNIYKLLRYLESCL